jgi:hypothetical protein
MKKNLTPSAPAKPVVRKPGILKAAGLPARVKVKFNKLPKPEAPAPAAE